METAKLYFECENCGQPFDIEINSGDFKCIEAGGSRAVSEQIYEFKSEFHCCGKTIELRIVIRKYPGGAYKRHDAYHKGLRNLRTGDNFIKIINEAR